MRSAPAVALLLAFHGAVAIGQPSGTAKPSSPATLERECLEGKAASCGSLGAIYRAGEGVDEDAAKSAVFYFRACAEGAPLSGYCREAGAGSVLAGQSPRGAADFESALDALEKTCDAGRLHDCNALGIIQMFVRQDPQGAPPLFERACDGGVASACGNLADAYVSGNGIPKDVNKSAELYGKACTGGFVSACSELGSMYLDRTIAGGAIKAVPLFKKACDMRELRGCQGLVAIYQENPSEASALFKKACGDDRKQCGEFDALIEGIRAGQMFRKR